MAEVTQYNFSLADVAALLIQEAGVKEGLWMIGVNFGIVVTSAGPDKDHVRPSALVCVENLLLTKTTEPGPLTFDAAEIRAKSK
jgi:hypothetical protein